MWRDVLLTFSKHAAQNLMFSLIRLSAAAAMRVDYLRANEEAVAAIVLEQVLQHREVFDEVLSDSLHYFSLQTTM